MWIVRPIDNSGEDVERADSVDKFLVEGAQGNVAVVPILPLGPSLRGIAPYDRDRVACSQASGLRGIGLLGLVVEGENGNRDRSRKGKKKEGQ